MDKINEVMLKNGLKLYLEKDPSIYGTISERDGFHVIEFYYRNVFQNEYKKDSMSEAKVKLEVLIKNGYTQFLVKDNESRVIKFSEFLNEYTKYALLPKDLRNKNILYHSSDFDGFIKVMKSNRLDGAHSYDYGVSTSRNKHYAFGRVEDNSEWGAEIKHNGGDIQLILDKDKLKNHYKIDAFDWEEWKTKKPETKKYSDFHQSEDKIKTSTIKDIKKYIIGVHIVKALPFQEYFDEWMTENDFDFEYIFDENWNDITKKYKI